MFRKDKIKYILESRGFFNKDYCIVGSSSACIHDFINEVNIIEISVTEKDYNIMSQNLKMEKVTKENECMLRTNDYSIVIYPNLEDIMEHLDIDEKTGLFVLSKEYIVDNVNYIGKDKSYLNINDIEYIIENEMVFPKDMFYLKGNTALCLQGKLDKCEKFEVCMNEDLFNDMSEFGEENIIEISNIIFIRKDNDILNNSILYKNDIRIEK